MLVVRWGSKLRQMGFRYWIVFDNHGGFTHQMALAEASRRLLKRGFCLVVPFLSIMLEMLEGVADIDLPLDRMGGLGDFHAGTNETSIMLAVDSRSVSKEYRSLSGYVPVKKTLLGRFLMLLGKRDIARALDWIGDAENPFYLGDPSLADSKSGEIMLTYHVRRSKQLLDEALSGRYNPPRRFKGFIKLLLKIFPEW
jgi:creatinine amidohydrolase